MSWPLALLILKSTFRRKINKKSAVVADNEGKAIVTKNGIVTTMAIADGASKIREAMAKKLKTIAG